MVRFLSISVRSLCTAVVIDDIEAAVAQAAATIITAFFVRTVNLAATVFVTGLSLSATDPGAVRKLALACPLEAESAFTAISATSFTPVIATYLARAIRLADAIVYTLAFFTGLPYEAVATASATTIAAALEVNAVGNTPILDTGSAVTGESSFALAAGSTTAIVTTVLVVTFRRTFPTLRTFRPTSPIIFAELNSLDARFAKALVGFAWFTDRLRIPVAISTGNNCRRNQE